MTETELPALAEPEEHLTDEEQERKILLEEARNDLLFYSTVCDPLYIPSRVHAFLAKKLQAVVDGKIKRLIISTPPRIGKSTISCVEMASYALGKNPDHDIVVASYGMDLPVESSRLCRGRLKSEEYQAIFKTRIAEGDSRVEHWGVANGKGGYKAVGVGGGLTGHNATILICDDLVKDFQAAQSETVLNHAWNWYHSVARTRLTQDGAIIFISTRWSPEDPIGRLTDPKRLKQIKESADVDVDMSGEQWEVVNLPALAKANDPLGRKEGESIFPEKRSEAHYRALKATSLPYIWSAMFDGEPTLIGGNYIPVSEFRIVEREDVPPNLMWARAWDLAATTKEQNDPSAGGKGCIGPDGTLYIADMVVGRWKWPQTRELIKTFACSELIPVGVEAVGGFKAAYDNLIEVIPSGIMCTAYDATKDKLSRALPWIAMLGKQKVALVRGPWVPDFLIEAQKFTGMEGGQDDQIDVVSLLYIMLHGGLRPPMPVSFHDRLSRAKAMRRNRSMDG